MIKFILSLVLLLPVKSFALLTVLDTGEIIESGNYRLGVQLQGVTDEPGGLNFAGHVYLPISSAWNLRLHAGTGQTEFNAGGGAKWIPIPDINHQPALGAIMEVEWASDNDFDIFYVRFAPLISKSFRWEYGAMSPYAAIPIGIYYAPDASDDKTDLFLQLALGVELDLEAFDNFTIVGEGGFDLKDSFSYVSIMGKFTF